MNCEIYQDILVLPYQSGKGGVYALSSFGSSTSGEFIEAFTCNLKQWYISRGEWAQPSHHIQEPAIFIGPLFHHIGHFLIDSVARLWYAKAHPELPIIWFDKQNYTDWQTEILALLGIHNRPIFISEPTSFSQVYLPQPGFIVLEPLEPEHSEFLACVEPSQVIPGKKGWLSRSLLDEKTKKRTGHLHYEGRLEEKLQNAGWEIYHPQLHTIQEQLQFLSSCEVIAGVQGSAFHLLLLLKKVHANIIIFKARGHHLINYDHFAQCRQWNQTIVEIPALKSIQTEAPQFKSSLCSNLSIFLDTLNVPLGNAPVNQEDHHLVKNLQAIMRFTDFKRYLEIGVHSGNSLIANPVPFRVGVDPNPRFDPRTCETPDLQLYEMTSDEYFIHYKHDEPFDIIYIDGLHRFEQAMRDFTNSLSVAHEKTLWVIDDTVPSDLYSALLTQEEAVALRQQDTGIYHRAWHGDVFKFVFALQAFFPMFDYFTTHQDCFNQQTFVWRSRREVTKPAVSTLSQISQLNYLDVLKYPEVFQYKTFQEGLETLKAFYQKIHPVDTDPSVHAGVK
jgi:hypothetical protein